MEIIINQRKLMVVTLITIICLACTAFGLNNSFERLIIFNIIKLILYIFWAKLLFLETGFQRSKFRLLVFIGVLSWILGIVINIQHWSFWFYIMLIGGGFIAIAYSFHFFKESKKTILDSLIYIWLMAFLIIHLLMHKHLANEEISWLPDILFCLSIIKFTQQNDRDFILMF